ncbi:MAG: Hsp70 family protein, partial [Myxococcota bacterium]
EARFRLDLNRDSVVAQRVMNAAENAKCALSVEPKVRINVPMIGQDASGKTVDLDYVMDRAELESLTAPLIEQCLGIAEQMMSDANVRPSEINHVLAVGGQTRMPLVRRRIAEMMGKPPLTHLDADTCVAYGAAIMARGDRDPAGAVLLDVLSVPVGVVFPGGRTQFVFRANCDLPAVQTVLVEPPPVGQELVVGLWQGVDITSADRQVLGVVRVPARAFETGGPYRLDFTIDADLALQVVFTSALQRISLPLEQTGRR